ncbi:hypothetical protein ABK040_014949 [Willaertia magna]
MKRNNDAKSNNYNEDNIDHDEKIGDYKDNKKLKINNKLLNDLILKNDKIKNNLFSYFTIQDKNQFKLLNKEMYQFIWEFEKLNKIKFIFPNLEEENNVNNLLNIYCKQLTNLECIDFSNFNNITDNILILFLKNNYFKKLNEIDLSCAFSLNGKGLLELPNKENIKILSLEGCLNIDELALKEIIKNYINLETLNLNDLQIVTDNILEEITKNCKNLKTLFLRNCNLISINGLKNLKNLENLAISYNENINNLNEIFNLKNLEIAHCPNLDFKDLKKFKNLISLDLSENDKVNDLTFDLLQMESLQKLFLTNCKNIKNINNLLKLKDLKHLDIIECENLQNLNTLQNFTNLTSFSFTLQEEFLKNEFSLPPNLNKLQIHFLNDNILFENIKLLINELKKLKKLKFIELICNQEENRNEMIKMLKLNLNVICL